MTDSRHPGLITPDNAPRLADLNDDTLPYPSQITVFCDECGDEVTADYLVPADATNADRLEIARDHMRTKLGWFCDENGDFCPSCTTAEHEHSYPISPPGGSFAKPGDCVCGHTWAESEKALAEERAKFEWSVWVAGLGVLTRQNFELADDDPENPLWTEDAARAFVEFANGEMQQIHRTGPNQAVLLHFGQPVNETAGA